MRPVLALEDAERTTPIRPLLHRHATTSGRLSRAADRDPIAARAVALALPTTAAVGASLISIDVAGFPMYPFKVLVPVALAVSLVAARRSIALERSTWCVLLLAAWATAGSLWAHDVTTAAHSALTIWFAVALFVLVQLWGSEFRRDLITGWRLALVVTGAVALVEILTGFHLASDFIVDREGQGYVLSVFSNPNDYGAFLAIAIPISLFPTRGRRIPLWAWALAGGSTALLLVSASRFALIGLLAAAIVALVRHRRSWWAVPTGWAALAIGIAAFVVLTILGADIASKLLSLTEEGSLGDTSAGIRIGLLANGVWAFFVTGGLGVAIGGFPEMIASGLAPVSLRAGVVDPHNMWFELLAELGLPGVVFFGVLLGSIWGPLRRSVVEPAATVAWASLAAYVAAVCTASAYLTAPVSWMFLATVASLSALGSSSVDGAGV